MTNYEFKRMAAAIESFGGGFFQSLVPAFNKADAINREILLEAFKQMEGSNKYLPGGIHYDDVTPEFGPSDLDLLQEHTMKFFGLSQ